jgi:hypothetical protein
MLSGNPEIARRHELFGAASSRFLESIVNGANISMSDGLRLLEVLLASGLDVIDGEAKRFRGNQVAQCIQSVHGLINTLVSGISRELSDEETVRFLICFAVAHSKGWIDSELISKELQIFVPQSVRYLSSGGAGYRRTCETLWAIGRLVESGVLSVDDAMRGIMRRGISESDLLPYRSSLGFSNIDPPEPSSFHILLQLDEAFPKLGLSDSSVARSVQVILQELSCSSENTTAPIDFIWWSAKAECGIHPLLVEWVSVCMANIDRMSRKERWICTNGVAHIVEISKRRNGPDWQSLADSQKMKLRFFIQKTS